VTSLGVGDASESVIDLLGDYRTSLLLALLHGKIEDVERHIFSTTANLFNLDVDVIFYDTTTASFAIDQEDEDEDDEEGLRRFGHAKEGTWTPQVVIALAVTRDGLPVRSWVLPGNTADVTTVVVGLAARESHPVR
jgi:transposase